MGESLHDRLDRDLIERFARDLDGIVSRGTRLGIAVSGGPDSVALLLLAAAARPGLIEAATVDHRLRSGSAEEAAFVARLCAALGVPHQILTVEWDEKPTAAIQERARAERYALLSNWAEGRALGTIVTGHHQEDQAETFLMRLARGSGLAGLAAMRPLSPLEGSSIALVRPLLSWSHEELATLCAAAGVSPVDDPSNSDPRFERVRVRNALGNADWLDATCIARSAAHLAEADNAIAWALEGEWARAVEANADEVVYRQPEAPNEIRRRAVARIILSLSSEGDEKLRGRELDRLLRALGNGEIVTLRGVRCAGGADWRFSRAPARS